VGVDWRNVVAEHGPIVWRTAFRLLGHHADAVDCCQDTFVAAWRFAEREEVTDWAPFLVSLTTRRAIDRLRRRVRTQQRFRGMDDVPEPTSHADCPVQAAQVRELLGRVRHELGFLPEKQAAAIWLSGVEGLTHEQISSQLQITKNEVGVLIHRARARLREALASNPRSGDS
jgi:RNA polymerase sigma factor (sigma-70 family)